MSRLAPGDLTGCWSWLLRRASTGHAGSRALRLLPVRSGSEARSDAPLLRGDAPLPRGAVPLPPSGSGRLPAYSRHNQASRNQPYSTK